MSHSEWLAILDDKHPVVDLAHSLCLPRGELKEKVSSMVAERFQMHSDLKTEAQKMLNYFIPGRFRLVWRVEMGAGNCSAQDQTLRLSWVKLLDYFFAPKTASFAALATRNLTTVLAGILIFCCVFGLKPVRAFLFCFTSLPNPGKTNSPFFLISL